MAAPSPHRSPDRPTGEHGDCAGACSGDGIPVVDLDVLLNGDGDQRSQAIRDLGRAFEDWGFFMVINHGVPVVLREAVMHACKELFSLPTDEKAEYIDAGLMDPIRIGTGFYSVVDGAKYWRDYVKMFTHPEFHCPAKPANLREISMEYSACTRDLLLELTKAIFESLGLDGDRISKALNLGSSPARSSSSPAISWRYKGVLHRALVGGEQARMSFVSLIGPCLDAVVEPVPELAHDGAQGLEFRGIRYGDYMEHQQSNKLNEKAALDIVRVQRDILTCEGAPNNSSIKIESASSGYNREG